jgi:hypothetical protein
MTTDDKHRTWAELSAVTQAALRCKDPVFRAFLEEQTNRYEPNELMSRDDPDFLPVSNEETAASIVRGMCEIESRRELATHSSAQAIWHDLDNLYQAWLARER